MSPKDKTPYELPCRRRIPKARQPLPATRILLRSRRSRQRELAEPGLLASDYWMLTTGASGLAQGVIDTRIHNVKHLANGPYQLTPGVPYDAYAGSPVHRFYQMWQQLDCNVKNATTSNPSGCLADLFPWVEVSISTGRQRQSTAPSVQQRDHS